jgi:hypothetical protein
MTKFQTSVLTGLKVAAHIGLSALVAGLIVLFSRNPNYLLLTPVINPFLSAIIKYFSLNVPNAPIDVAPNTPASDS